MFTLRFSYLWILPCLFSYSGRFSNSLENLCIPICVFLKFFNLWVLPWVCFLFWPLLKWEISYLCFPFKENVFLLNQLVHSSLDLVPILATLAIQWEICVFVLPNGESALFHSWSCLIVIHYTGITTQLITKTRKHENGKCRNVNTNT